MTQNQKLRQENMAQQESTDKGIKIGEIRTMAGDIARIRFLEAQKERERITGIKMIKEEEEIRLEEKEKLSEEEIRKKEEERKLKIKEEEERARAEQIKREVEQRKALEEKKRLEEERIIVEKVRKEAREQAQELKAKEEILSEIKEEEDLKRERPKIQAELEKLIIERKPLEKERDRLLEKKREMEELLAPVIKREGEIEEKIKLLEERERQVETVKERQEVEGARWNLEKKRKQVEKKRWEREKLIQDLNAKIENTELKIGELKFQEEKIRSRIEEIEKRIEEIRLERRKFQILEELRKIPEKRKPLEAQKLQLFGQKDNFLSTLQKISEEEEDIEEEKIIIEEKEKTAQVVKERREAEMSRWKLEEKRKETEKKRWNQEAKIDQLNLQLKDLEERLNVVKNEEENLKEKVREIDFALLKLTVGEKVAVEMITRREGPSQGPSIVKPEKEERLAPLDSKHLTGLEVEIEKPEVETARILERKSEEPEVTVPVGEEMERIKTAKRLEEARKRVEALRRAAEKETETEEEKKEIEAPPPPKPRLYAEVITPEPSISPGPELFPEALKTIPEEEPLAPFEKHRVEIFRPVPQKPSPKERYLVRVLIVTLVAILIACLITFWYWYFFQRERPSPSPETPKQEQPEEVTPPKEAVPPEEISPPSSLFPIENSKTLKISSLETLPNLLASTLNEKLDKGELTRIIIENVAENKFLGLKDFFEIFQIKSPEGLLDNLEDGFTLFLHGSATENRLGFVAKIKNKEGFSNFLTSWEETMKNDFQTLFLVLGEDRPASVPYFREKSFKQTTVRFLTISKDDFGICYAIFDDYFIFTTSFEAIQKVLEEMEQETEAIKIEDKIGQLFIIGFEGKSLTPEVEKTFKKYQPGGVLLLSKNIDNQEQLKKLIADLQALSLKETGLPLLVAVDQEGGPISRVSFLKEKTSQSEIKDSSQAYQVGLIRGMELKELGINLNLAPVLDITNKQDFLYNRSFQKNPTEVGNLAKSLIQGQKTAGILTAIKHFPGYSGIVFNPEEKLAIKETVSETSQFEKVMEANPEFILTANVIYKELDSALPFTFSSAAIQFLKDNLGSQILIISDDLSQSYLLENFSLKETVVKPIQAGVDILLLSGYEVDVTKSMAEFHKALEGQEISWAQLDEKISKITQLKQSLIYY